MAIGVARQLCDIVVVIGRGGIEVELVPRWPVGGLVLEGYYSKMKHLG